MFLVHFEPTVFSEVVYMGCTIPKYGILGVLHVGGVPPYGGAGLKPAEDAEYILGLRISFYRRKKSATFTQKSLSMPFYQNNYFVMCLVHEGRRLRCTM